MFSKKYFVTLKFDTKNEALQNSKWVDFESQFCHEGSWIPNFDTILEASKDSKWTASKVYCFQNRRLTLFWHQIKST